MIDWTYTVVLPLAGGVAIGLAALMLFAFNGKIAGISGITAGALTVDFDTKWAWRVAFLAGLVGGGALMWWWMPQAFPTGAPLSAAWVYPVAGALVGLGTRLGNGCTSGHGVCGMGRLSKRSFVATLTFMLAGFATVAIMRHVLA